MSNPLPEPVAHVHSDGDFCQDRLYRTEQWPVYFFTADQLRAHAAAEVSAARDCRTCANLTSVKTCRHRRFGEEQCIDADKYEALPPVRLWRKK